MKHPFALRSDLKTKGKIVASGESPSFGNVLYFGRFFFCFYTAPAFGVDILFYTILAFVPII